MDAVGWGFLLCPQPILPPLMAWLGGGKHQPAHGGGQGAGPELGGQQAQAWEGCVGCEP